MPIVLFRIDDRLIHGQVVEGWIPALRISRVIVISDRAASDSIERALMHLAMPEAVALDVFSSKDAVGVVREAATIDDRVLVLAPGPEEFLVLLDNGISIDSINVGGLHYAAGRVQLGKAVFLSESEMRALQSLSERGVRLEGRAVPFDRPGDLAALLKARA